MNFRRRLEKLEQLLSSPQGEDNNSKIKEAMKRMLVDQNLYNAAASLNRLIFPDDPKAEVDEKEFAAACANFQNALGWTDEK